MHAIFVRSLFQDTELVGSLLKYLAPFAGCKQQRLSLRLRSPY